VAPEPPGDGLNTNAVYGFQAREGRGRARETWVMQRASDGERGMLRDPYVGDHRHPALPGRLAFMGVGLPWLSWFWEWGRVDPAARHASPWFRLLIVPGVAALWPLLLRLWVNSPRSGT